MKVVAISSSTRRFSITISRHGNVVHGFGCVCGGFDRRIVVWFNLNDAKTSLDNSVDLARRGKSCGYING